MSPLLGQVTFLEVLNENVEFIPSIRSKKRRRNVSHGIERYKYYFNTKRLFTPMSLLCGVNFFTAMLDIPHKMRKCSKSD